jgi:hypothetical protein
MLPPRFERFNVVEEEVIVIPKVGTVVDCSKKRRVVDGCDVVLDSEGGLAYLQENLGVSNTETLDSTQPALSSRVGGIVDTPPKNHFLSQLVSKEIMHRYEQAEEKLRRELAAVLLDDNIWYLRSWNANGVDIVWIHCVKCIKDFRDNMGEHSNHSISNLFAKFRMHHLNTNAHIQSLCR